MGQYNGAGIRFQSGGKDNLEISLAASDTADSYVMDAQDSVCPCQKDYLEFLDVLNPAFAPFGAQGIGSIGRTGDFRALGFFDLGGVSDPDFRNAVREILTLVV